MDTILKSSVFTPLAISGKGKRGGLTPLALTDKVVVPHLPANSSDETKRAFLFLVMCSGTSVRKSLNEWKAYIATYVVAMFPTLSSRIPSNLFTLSQLADTQVESINSMFTSFKTALSSRDETGVSTIVSQLAASSVIPGLPTLNPSLDWKTANQQWATKILMGHFSLVLFLIGKRIEGDDHSALAINRPDAIKKKAHLYAPMAFLDGDLRLSDTSHNLINNAWAELSGLRALVLLECAKFSQSDTDFSQDIIYTTMHLLKWSGMQHARITMDFIRAYPWVAQVPSLRTSLAVYIESVKALEKVDPFTRSYVKLIYGDKSAVFPRKELEPLVACAVSVAVEVSETLRDFYVSNAYAPIVDAFNEERARREGIREAELKQKELSLGITIEEEVEFTPQETEDVPAELGIPE